MNSRSGRPHVFDSFILDRLAAPAHVQTRQLEALTLRDQMRGYREGQRKPGIPKWRSMAVGEGPSQTTGAALPGSPPLFLEPAGPQGVPPLSESVPWKLAGFPSPSMALRNPTLGFGQKAGARKPETAERDPPPAP